MTPEEILAKTADRVERGWCQWTFRDGKGNVCIYGAMHEVCGFKHGTPLPVEAYRAEGALYKEIGDHPSIWQDKAGRIKEEVVSAIRNAKRWL